MNSYCAGKQMIDDEQMLSELLRDGHLLALWARDVYGKHTVGLFVDCGDLFDWGTADCEPIPPDKITELYYSVQEYGSASVWACLHRRQRPQPPVEREMRAADRWPDELEALPPRNKTSTHDSCSVHL